MDHQGSDDDSLTENDDGFKDEDYDDDQSVKDDILKPASTRSKIVVNLKMDPVTKTYDYELDPYDKVRMQLIFDNQALYNAYLTTI